MILSESLEIERHSFLSIQEPHERSILAEGLSNHVLAASAGIIPIFVTIQVAAIST